MPALCIETRNLTKVFSNKIAVNNLNLNIPKGGIHALVGSNGAGKSTLFRLLMGVETPSSGEASILNHDCSSLSPDTRGRIGYVNEEHTLPNWMKVGALLALQKSLYKNWNEETYQNVIGYFDVQVNQKISSLSRGERAGFNLAMAMAQSPEILILDEPTLGLDVVAKQSFLEAVMFTEQENESSIIYCSHQMEEIERVAENLIVMEQGQLTNNSSPDEFVSRVSAWVGDFSNAKLMPKHVPGLLTAKHIDGLYYLMLADQERAHIHQFLESKAVSSIQTHEVSLPQAVNAFLSKNHHAPS